LSPVAASVAGHSVDFWGANHPSNMSCFLTWNHLKSIIKPGILPTSSEHSSRILRKFEQHVIFCPSPSCNNPCRNCFGVSSSRSIPPFFQCLARCAQRLGNVSTLFPRLHSSVAIISSCRRRWEATMDHDDQWLRMDDWSSLTHMLHVWYIYLQNWVIYGANVGKYSIHGAYGLMMINGSWRLMIMNMFFNDEQWLQPVTYLWSILFDVISMISHQSGTC
jgi:hypothetical protein